jgi:hypothetical protein
MSLNLLAGVSMKSRVSPVLHPLDQFRRDEPLPEKQGQDVGLEEVPKNSVVEEGGVDETAVRPEGPGGSQDMQVGINNFAKRMTCISSGRSERCYYFSDRCKAEGADTLAVLDIAANLEHFYQGMTEGGADILLAASVFHFRTISIGQVKVYLKGRGIPVLGV